MTQATDSPTTTPDHASDHTVADLVIPAPFAYAILAGVVITTAALDAGIMFMEGMIVHLRAAA